MRILVDADGCPVVEEAVAIAVKNNLECFLLCDTAHVLQKEGAKTLTFSTGADSVDFALVNLAKAGDIVVTQDYGLAAMCLARGCIPLDQNGRVYYENNIDSLLQSRHLARKIRRGGGRLKGSAKRKAEQNHAFMEALRKIVEEH